MDPIERILEAQIMALEHQAAAIRMTLALRREVETEKEPVDEDGFVHPPTFGASRK